MKGRNSELHSSIQDGASDLRKLSMPNAWGGRLGLLAGICWTRTCASDNAMQSEALLLLNASRTSKLPGYAK